MKETFGLITAKNAKPPNPKPSPKDFVWPSQSDHDDKVAQKIAATLQELLPKREWKHTDLARALYGGAGPNDSPKNVGATRRWVVAEHPIPNAQTAGYIAEVLGISMARLLEPEGKFVAFPPFIRGRSDSKRFPFNGDKEKTPSGRDRKKQQAYNEAYRARRKAGQEKRPYVRKVPLEKEAVAAVNGKANGSAWVLAPGVAPPTYKISSSEAHSGHVELDVKAVLPHQRAMAILHMLQHEAAEKAE
jgi:hypothetical protein